MVWIHVCWRWSIPVQFEKSRETTNAKEFLVTIQARTQSPLWERKRRNHWYPLRNIYTLLMQSIFLYWREFLSGIAVIIALLSYAKYIETIYRGKTEPHVISWWIWALTTGIAFFAKLSGWGWWGTAQNGITFLVCVYIAILAWKFGKIGKFHTLDWYSLSYSILAILLWFLTENAFYGSLFAMLADSIGYIPTFRKVWYKPNSEPISYYLLMNIKHGLSLAALSVYSWTTMVFSASVILINFLLISVILFRKKV